jgi:hypothetical protein
MHTLRIGDIPFLYMDLASALALALRGLASKVPSWRYVGYDRSMLNKFGMLSAVCFVDENCT